MHVHFKFQYIVHEGERCCDKFLEKTNATAGKSSKHLWPVQTKLGHLMLKDLMQKIY